MWSLQAVCICFKLGLAVARENVFLISFFAEWRLSIFNCAKPELKLCCPAQTWFPKTDLLVDTPITIESFGLVKLLVSKHAICEAVSASS
jgi:hypothetical protein